MTTATQTQLRRDTATNVNIATPAAGEPAWDVTNKILRIGDGSTAGGIHQVGAKQSQIDYYLYGTVGGTGNAITATNIVPMISLVAGLKQKIKATATNTGAVTFAPDGLTTKNVKKMLDGALTDLVAGDIVNGGIYKLEYDGTQWQIQGLGVKSATPSGLVLLAAPQTASNSTSIDFTSLISATYDDYLILMDSVLPVSAAVDLVLVVSANNGVSYDTAGDYYNTVSSANNITIAPSLSNTTGYGFNGEVKGYNLNSASVNKVFTSFGATRSTVVNLVSTAGLWTTASAINALRFKMSSGNIASGVFKIYGISKV